MIIDFLKKVGVAKTDNEENILQKNFMLYLGCAMSVGGIVWGTICIWLGLVLQCIIPYAYTILTFLNFCRFNKTKNFNRTRFIQVLLSLFLPFAFQFVMGGFVASGGAMLWAIISLIAALTFISFRNAFYWLSLYIIFTIVMGIIDSYSVLAYEPSATISSIFFVINFTFISSIVFGLSYYFIGSRITALQNVEVAKQLAVVASKSKSEFLANMSHEIRTPLNGVIGFIDVLKNTKLDDTQKQYLTTVGQSANSLLSIVNDILDFSKVESGKLELSFDETNLRKMGEQLINLTHITAEEKGLKLLLKVSENLPTFILADELRLRQVFINLLGNAIKFTKTGEIELAIDVISKSKEECFIRFAVRDTGIGINKQYQEKIFEAFSQEDNTTTKKYGGTGLGLSISNKMLELMGSKLNLISEVGKGSLFYFDASFKITVESVATDSNKVSNAKNILTENGLKDENIKKILVAEDNKVNMMLTKLFLKEIFPNAEIIEVQNGKEAIVKNNMHKPDIIFMDVQMPEMNGLEATAEIRKHEIINRTLIIALTAGVTNGEMEKCLDAGMDNYVSKPFTKDSLLAVLKSCLEN
jgi:signal transduction histidine kinase/ActR/RegA family two-component response regulator